MQRIPWVFQSQSSVANTAQSVVVDLRLSADPPANPQKQKKFAAGPLIVIIGFAPAMIGGPGPITLRNRAGAIIAQSSPTSMIAGFFTVGAPAPLAGDIVNSAGQLNQAAVFQNLCMLEMPDDEFLQIDVPAAGAGVVSRVAIFGLSTF